MTDVYLQKGTRVTWGPGRPLLRVRTPPEKYVEPTAATAMMPVETGEDIPGDSLDDLILEEITRGGDTSLNEGINTRRIPSTFEPSTAPETQVHST